MSLSRFARYDVGAAIVWSVLFTGIGYGFGAAVTAAIGEIEHDEWLVLCAIVVLGLLVHLSSKRLLQWIEPTLAKPSIQSK